MKTGKRDIKWLICIAIAAMLIAISVISAQEPPPTNDVIVDVTHSSQTGMPGDTIIYSVNLTNNGTVPDIIVVDNITGVPTGWTVDLKDAGASKTLPYTTPVLQSKTNYVLTLDVHVPATATTGATMTINIHSQAQSWLTDSDTFVCLVTNAPVLSAGAVNPATGDTTTTFTYSVTYTDADNDAPSTINVVIDGTPQAMTVKPGEDGDYTNGEIYEYATTGAVLGGGSHTYQFNASDGVKYATGDTGSHSGPALPAAPATEIPVLSPIGLIALVCVISVIVIISVHVRKKR